MKYLKRAEKLRMDFLYKLNITTVEMVGAIGIFPKRFNF